MASLALAVAVVMFAVWGLAALSLAASFLGFRSVGAAMGALSVVAGLWLLCVLPHAPFIGLLNLVAGGVAIGRYFANKNEEDR